MHKKKSFHGLHDGILELNYHEYVKRLFANTEHVNARTELGETPIHLAAFWGKLDKFYALVNMGQIHCWFQLMETMPYIMPV